MVRDDPFIYVVVILRKTERFKVGKNYLKNSFSLIGLKDDKISSVIIAHFRSNNKEHF